MVFRFEFLGEYFVVDINDNDYMLDLINKNRWPDETYTMAEFLELCGDVEEIKIE